MKRPADGSPLAFYLCILLIWGLGVSYIAGPILAQTSSQIERQNIHVDVNLATLKFTVKKPSGSLINNLTREDFRVFEAGVPQEITFFDPPRNRSGKIGSLRLAFLIDMSGSTFATRAEEITAALTFLENVDDFTEVGVFGFTDKLIPLQDFTATRSLAQKALSRARRQLGQTAIYTSLDELILRLNSRSAGVDRNVIIVISDGMDDAYRRAGRTIALAGRNNVVIYTIRVPSAAQLYIGPFSPASQPPANDQASKESAFSSLALRTNGKYFSGFETILDFDEVMAQINDDVFGNLYSIGYYTEDPYRDKAERHIRVEIRHPDAYIPARFENLPGKLTAKKEFVTALFDNDAIKLIANNLRHFHEIGAEMDLLRPRREGGQIGLPFRIKISPHPLQGEKGDVRTQFGVIGVLLDPGGREVVRLREIFRVDLDAKDIREGRGIIYTNKLLAPPGIYSLKIALLEIATWKMTVFEKDVRIKEP